MRGIIFGSRAGRGTRCANTHRWGMMQSEWVRLGSVHSGSVPKFRQFCNLSCAASAAHLQAGAAKCCELGAAKCTQVRRIPASSLGGDVNFRLRQAVRVQFKGGSIYYEIQRAPDNDVGHFDSTMLTRLDKHTNTHLVTAPQ
jgi:hypothetical protein